MQFPRPGGSIERANLAACVIAVALAGGSARGAVPAAPAVVVAWQGVVAHSPEYAAAIARRDAGLASAAEARALWLPTLAAQGGAGRRSLDTSTTGARFAAPSFGASTGVVFDTSVVGGSERQWAFVLQQPLLDAGRVADAEALGARARLARAQFRSTEQALMLRTAEAVAAVTEAALRLGATQRQREAALRARDAAQARFDAGDLPVTEWREAQAQCDLLVVDELDAQQAFAIANDTYANLTGLPPPAVPVATGPDTDAAPMADAHPAMPAAGGAPDDELAAWLRLARQHSPEIELAERQVEIASAEQRRWSRIDGLQLNVVGQFGRETLSGHGDYGESGMTQRLATIGLQATLPLFTGGMRSAQRRAAEAGLRAANADLATVVDRVQLATRSAWLAAGNARARLRALELVRESAALRLDATRIGHDGGDRTLEELLSAQAAALQAGTSAAAAHCEALLARLRLAASAGTLDAEALAAAAESERGCAPAGD